MGHHHVDISSFEEQFTFTAAAKRPFIIALGVGIVLTIIGIFLAMSGGEHHAQTTGPEGSFTIARGALLIVARCWLSDWLRRG